MRTIVSLWLGLGLLAGGMAGCFEDAVATCTAGLIGCECSISDACEQGTCELGYCMPLGCAPGTQYCRCDSAPCVEGLACVDGVICLAPDEVPETAGVDAGAATSGTSGDASTSGTSGTSGASTSSGTSAGTTGPAACDPPCGACSRCDDGACVPDVGQPCDGTPLSCDQFVWGVDTAGNTASCRAYAAETLDPVCDPLGRCLDPDPDECGNEAGVALVTCDTACIADAAACAPNVRIDLVSGAAMCATNTTTASCSPRCFMGTGWTAHDEACNASGQCESIDTYCGNYVCESGACLQSCDTDDDCYLFVGAVACVDNACVMQ